MVSTHKHLCWDRIGTNWGITSSDLECQGRFRHHSGPVMSSMYLELSNDQKWLVSIAKDALVCVWDIATRECLAQVFEGLDVLTWVDELPKTLLLAASAQLMPTARDGNAAFFSRMEPMNLEDWNVFVEFLVKLNRLPQGCDCDDCLELCGGIPKEARKFGSEK